MRTTRKGSRLRAGVHLESNRASFAARAMSVRKTSGGAVKMVSQAICVSVACHHESMPRVRRNVGRATRVAVCTKTCEATAHICSAHA